MDESRNRMGSRNREMETGCQIALVAIVVVACFAGIPPLVDGVTRAFVQPKVDAAPILPACRSCGEVEDVRELTLAVARHNVSTISGESLAMFLALLAGKLGNEPVKVKEVSVRMQDGSLRVFHEAATSGWNDGDRVKISMGRIKPVS